MVEEDVNPSYVFFVDEPDLFVEALNGENS
jgi:hypothetical protein